MENVTREPRPFQASEPDNGEALFMLIKAFGVIELPTPAQSDRQVYGGKKAVSA